MHAGEVHGHAEEQLRQQQPRAQAVLEQRRVTPQPLARCARAHVSAHDEPCTRVNQLLHADMQALVPTQRLCTTAAQLPLSILLNTAGKVCSQG